MRRTKVRRLNSLNVLLVSRVREDNKRSVKNAKYEMSEKTWYLEKNLEKMKQEVNPCNI